MGVTGFDTMCEGEKRRKRPTKGESNTGAKIVPLYGQLTPARKAA